MQWGAGTAPTIHDHQPSTNAVVWELFADAFARKFGFERDQFGDMSLSTDARIKALEKLEKLGAGEAEAQTAKEELEAEKKTLKAEVEAAVRFADESGISPQRLCDMRIGTSRKLTTEAAKGSSVGVGGMTLDEVALCGGGGEVELYYAPPTRTSPRDQLAALKAMMAGRRVRNGVLYFAVTDCSYVSAPAATGANAEPTYGEPFAKSLRELMEKHSERVKEGAEPPVNVIKLVSQASRPLSAKAMGDIMDCVIDYCVWGLNFGETHATLPAWRVFLDKLRNPKCVVGFYWMNESNNSCGCDRATRREIQQATTGPKGPKGNQLRVNREREILQEGANCYGLFKSARPWYDARNPVFHGNQDTSKVLFKFLWNPHKSKDFAESAGQLTDAERATLNAGIKSEVKAEVKA